MPPSRRVPNVSRTSLKRAARFEPKPARTGRWRRAVQWLFVLVGVVIIIDALFGDRGLVDTVRARREYAALEAHVARTRAENARLRDEARRLREDPTTIESLAREDLGLIHPGERLFIIRELPPAPARIR
jgi:cell division protein FtsB